LKRCGIGDIHLSFYSNDKLDKNNFPERLIKIINALKYVAKYCRENNIKHIDILGDLNHDKNIVYIDALKLFIDFIEEYNDIDFTILSGNHDLTSLTNQKNSIVSLLKHHKNIVYIDKPTVLDNITIVPYSNNLVQEISDCEPNDILLSHFGLNEAKLQSGLSIVSDISLAKLKKWKLVLLGHYHGPQDLNNKTTWLYYVGNLVHLNWNDKNEKKRFLIYDTKTLEVESIPIEGFSEYIQFIVEDKEDFKEVFEKAKKLKEAGNFVRIRKKFSEDIEEDLGDDLLVIDEKEVDITKRDILIDMSLDEKLKKYLEIKEIKDDNYLEVLKKEDIL
tara:strand:+ start:93 stop:1091 length:999 start_codon:yes stop_codon:yes gene_type:complete